MTLSRHFMTTTATIAMALSATQISAQELTRIATMPAGAEVTGLSTNQNGDLFLNAQHPGGKNTFKDDAPAAFLGYVKGFDAAAISGPGMDLPAENLRNSVQVAAGEYVTFGKAGDMLGSGQVLGGVYDTSGTLMYISNTPDYNGFVKRSENSAYLYTAWEGAGRDAASSISRLSLNLVDGAWRSDLSSSRMIDLSGVYGGAVLCSGVVTPWGTPLVAEEYFYYNTGVWNHPGNHDEDERASFQDGTDITYIKPKSMSKYLGEMANPYRYGYMIEIMNPGSNSAEVPVKQYATGRLSHETAAIMPDNKTLYMSDDDSAIYSDKVYNTASGGVLFKFVADIAGDLSSGTLSAAKLQQDDETDPHKAGFNVTWVELGHGNNAQIESWISEYDGIGVDAYVDGQTNFVTDDQIRAHAAGQAQDQRAAFLESRRTAAAMGATNEWDKLEGVTSSGNAVYIAASGIAFTMDKGWGTKDWSTGEVDAANAGDIGLNAEGCGGTYFSITDDSYNITRIDPFVIGKTNEDGSCDANRPANPDNILALNDGIVLIGEDAGSKRHELDMLWMVK